MPQFPEGLFLDLPDPFLGHVETPAHLLSVHGLGEADAEEKGTGKVDTAEKIAYAADGSIAIPASLHLPLSNDIQTMKSVEGGYQVFLPRFFHQGKTIMRGGAWKGGPDGCASGRRLLSDGYGVYEDWGLRAEG